MGFHRRKRKPRRPRERGRLMLRVQRMELDEGLEYMHKPSHKKIDGVSVERTTQTRHLMFLSGQISCVKCGIKGTHFYIERGARDKVMPFSVNLYGLVASGPRMGEEVMLTFDHKLPKSLGGSDAFENAQCMCERCNMGKGNKCSLSELMWAATHPNLLTIFKMPKNVRELNQVGVNSIFDTINVAKKEFKKLRAGVDPSELQNMTMPKNEEPPKRYDSTGKLISKGDRYSVTLQIKGFKTTFQGKISSIRPKARVCLAVSSSYSDDGSEIIPPPLRFITTTSTNLIPI